MRHSIATQVHVNLEKSYSKIVADDFLKQYDLYVKNIKLLSGVTELYVAHVFGFFAAQNIDIKALSSKFAKLNLTDQVDVLARSYAKSFNAKQRYLVWRLNDEVSVTFDLVKRDLIISDNDALLEMQLNDFRTKFYNLLKLDNSHLNRFNRIYAKDAMTGNERLMVIMAQHDKDNEKRVRFAGNAFTLTDQNMNELTEIMNIIG